MYIYLWTMFYYFYSKLKNILNIHNERSQEATFSVNLELCIMRFILNKNLNTFVL